MEDHGEVEGMASEICEEERIERQRMFKVSGPREKRAKTIVSVSPFRCRVWALHDRLEDYVTEESCRSEIQSFSAHGQLVPALGRPLRADPDYDVEIVYGARRLFVARHLGVALKVELREMTDREAIVAMDIENRHRRDISPYERGLTYLRWLRSKYFESQDDIANALNVSPSQVSRLLKLSQLPSVVVSAFASPLDIREGWGVDLYRAWHDKRMQPLIAQRARALAERNPKLNAHEVYRKLLAPVGTVTATRACHRDEVVRAHTGSPLFRIRHQRKTVALLIPSSTLAAGELERLRDAVSQILQRESRQANDIQGGPPS